MTTFEITAVSPGLPVDDFLTQEPATAAEILGLAGLFFDPGTAVTAHRVGDSDPGVGDRSSEVVVGRYGGTVFVFGDHGYSLPREKERSFIHLEYNDTGESVNIQVSGPAGDREILGTDEAGLTPEEGRAHNLGDGTPLPFEQPLLDLVRRTWEAEDEDDTPFPAARMWFDEFCTWAFGFALVTGASIVERRFSDRALERWALRPVPGGTPGVVTLTPDGQVSATATRTEPRAAARRPFWGRWLGPGQD